MPIPAAAVPVPAGGLISRRLATGNRQDDAGRADTRRELSRLLWVLRQRGRRVRERGRWARGLSDSVPAVCITSNVGGRMGVVARG